MTLKAQNENGRITVTDEYGRVEKMRGEVAPAINQFADAVVIETYRDKSFSKGCFNVHQFVRQHINAEPRNILRIWRAVINHPTATRFALGGRGLAATFVTKFDIALIPVKAMKERKDFVEWLLANEGRKVRHEKTEDTKHA